MVQDPRDVFISHAGEDKADVARPIAEALISQGWSVWLDEYELTVGDSLIQRINAGLAASRFGVVVLSRAFFGKHWPKQELDGLAAKEASSGSKVILPVWHGIDQHYLACVAPMLADRVGVSTSKGIPHVAEELLRALARDDPNRRELVVRSPDPSTAPHQDAEQASRHGVPPPLTLLALPAPSRQGHAMLALNEQKQRGKRLLSTGRDDEPQEYTALIRTHSPETFSDAVSAWVNETAAMIEIHTDTERATFFLSDDGLSGGPDPGALLQRRLHRLETILRKLSDDR